MTLVKKDGRAFEAKNMKCNINDKTATLQIDIASAYPKEAGIIRWNRTITLNRRKNQVELTDGYVLAEKTKFLQQSL